MREPERSPRCRQAARGGRRKRRGRRNPNRRNPVSIVRRRPGGRSLPGHSPAGKNLAEKKPTRNPAVSSGGDSRCCGRSRLCRENSGRF